MLQRMLVVVYRRFETAYQSHLHGSSSPGRKIRRIWLWLVYLHSAKKKGTHKLLSFF